MPIAMVLRSVPLVAMTPLITLIFGRGLDGRHGHRRHRHVLPDARQRDARAAADARRRRSTCSGRTAPGRCKTLRKVQLPHALPAIFASLRIAAPLALIGALLAEWLATGHGLGYLMLQSSSLSNYNMLWTAAALVTAYSMLLYASISGVEKRVLARFADVPA